MKTLRQSFVKNELPYTLIIRNDKVAMYGIGGTYTDKILHYEVCRICFNHGGAFGDAIIEPSETIPSNEKFGTEGSLAIIDYNEALEYFDELTVELNTPKENTQKN